MCTHFIRSVDFTCWLAVQVRFTTWAEASVLNLILDSVLELYCIIYTATDLNKSGLDLEGFS